MAKPGRKHDAKGRSKGTARFVQIPYWVLETDAACALSGSALKVMIYLTKQHNGSNNGAIRFGARAGCWRSKPGSQDGEIVSINIGRSAIAEALEELEAAGFIRCERQSTFSRDTDYKTGQRMVREWRLTWLPDGQHAATKEFVTATPDPKRGFRKPPKKQIIRPAHRTMGKPTVRHTGQPTHENKPKGALQSGTPDYALTSQSATPDTYSNHPIAPVSSVDAAMADIAAGVSEAVLHSPLGSAARGPQGSQRDGAHAPNIDLVSTLAARKARKGTA